MNSAFAGAACEVGDRVRDLYEIELFWEFVIQQKPVLGICLGVCQVVSCGLGLLVGALAGLP